MADFAKWIQMNLDFVQTTFVLQVEPKEAQLALDAFIERLKVTADLLTDDNKDDKAQLVELWGSFTADPKMVEAFHVGFDHITASFKDGVVVSGIELVREKLIQTLIVLTDANKMNGEQVAEIWKNFFKTPEFLAFVAENGAVILSKLPLPAWLKSILNLFIKH